MIRMVLAAAAAFALVSATPALACPNCNTADCPMHKDKVAAAEKAAKKDGDKKPTCACAAEGKECKCGEKCACPNCPAKHGEKKDAGKKSS